MALVEEGLRLREAGIDARTLVLTEFPRGAEKEALAAGLTPTLYTDEGLDAVAEAAGALGSPLAAHVKLDTGMHRVGLVPELAPDFCRRLLDAGLDLEGVWTHFASADEPDDPSANVQLSRFHDALRQLDQAGIRPRFRHAANSAAVIALPDSHFDLVRLGVALYGISPGPALDGRADLQPAMSWRSTVAMVKRVTGGEGVSYGLRYRLEGESTIATVPVGYADGYHRAASAQAQVLIRGRRYPVAGTITMDQLTVDCGDDSVEPGDEVLLFGRQGDERITAEEVAGWAGTIGYEVVCAVSDRVPREYRG